MSYKKFDDPNLKSDDSKMKVVAGTPKEALQRALQGISNRVMGGTDGKVISGGVALGTDATGILTATPVFVAINGVAYVIGANSNINLGTGAYAGKNYDANKGTMGTNCVCKFLVFAGTAGTTDVDVAGPGNIILKSDYASAALAAAACKLPDLPENKVALGYLLLQGPEASGVTFNKGGAGTMGTCTFVNFVHMPSID